MGGRYSQRPQQQQTETVRFSCQQNVAGDRRQEVQERPIANLSNQMGAPIQHGEYSNSEKFATHYSPGNLAFLVTYTIAHPHLSPEFQSTSWRDHIQRNDLHDR